MISNLDAPQEPSLMPSPVISLDTASLLAQIRSLGAVGAVGADGTVGGRTRFDRRREGRPRPGGVQGAQVLLDVVQRRLAAG